MSDLQCPKCGKPSKGVCAECFIKDHPIAVKPETFKECHECGIAFFKGRWYEDREELIRDIAKKSIKPPSDIDARVLDVKSETNAGRLMMDAEVQGQYSGSFFKRNITWDIRPEKLLCDSCKKLGSGYYEAILQVRDGIELDLDPKQVGNIQGTRGGLDYYMISMDYARQKVSDLIAKGFMVVQSTKLHGKKNGKDVFRFYYSIKRPKFAVGDFIDYKGKVFRVRELAKNVKLTELATGKPTSATTHQLEDARVAAKSADVRQALVTSLRPDGMQIMDSDSCATHDVRVKEDLRQGDTVEYVSIAGRVYMV